MFKNILFCALIAWVCIVAPSVYAGRVELTTYYPSPYGEYEQLQANQLQTKKLALGSTTSQPATEGNMVFKSQEDGGGGAHVDPALSTAGNPVPGVQGEVAYSGSADALYYHNASTWSPLVGFKCYAHREFLRDPAIGVDESYTIAFPAGYFTRAPVVLVQLEQSSSLGGSNPRLLNATVPPNLNNEATWNNTLRFTNVWVDDPTKDGFVLRINTNIAYNTTFVGWHVNYIAVGE